MMVFYQLQKKLETSLDVIPWFLTKSDSFMTLHIQMHFIEQKEKKNR